MSQINRGRFSVSNPGRPFVKADSADVLTRNNGQWVRRANYPKPSRLVNGVLMTPHNTGPKAKQTVPMVQFRLACGRSLTEVYGNIVVNATPTVEDNINLILQLIA